MLIAGLTGGLASGKTFVAETLRDLGCHIVEADALGHEAMRPHEEAWRGIVEAFGTGILTDDQHIDRARLAGLVFNDTAALGRLNSIVHPAVRELAGRRFREIGESDPHAVIIYVAAILIETGAWRQFEKLILTTCSREQQIERALERPGATLADILARLERQLPAEKKAEFADYIIDTSGAKQDTLRQTKMVYEDLRRLAS
jgi:dephospho-CoA kinase